MSTSNATTPRTDGTSLNGSPEVRIEMRSNPLYLSGAREMLAAVARRLGFSEEACGQIALAVDEALCNVIRHGYDRASDKPIWVSLWPVGAMQQPGGKDCTTEALRIIIEDEARQVDPAVIKSRNLDDVRPGGLGVHIIRAVMDEVTYEKREKGGMRLTMIKKRTDSPIGGGARKDGGCEPCDCGDTAPKEGANG
jgi:anti-sigma regulatory factor (Ser/Thr protein kinase)